MEPGEKIVHKGVYLLPNALTTGAMFAGFYSIISGINGHYTAAAVASTSRPRPDIGRRATWRTHPDRLAHRRLTVRSVLRFVSGFHPTPPHGDAIPFGFGAVAFSDTDLHGADTAPSWAHD